MIESVMYWIGNLVFGDYSNSMIWIIFLWISWSWSQMARL